jgi:uncharacterized protein with HEPN domain
MNNRKLQKSQQFIPDPSKNAQPHSLWREWAGMRDFLIYSYDSIDPERIKIP